MVETGYITDPEQLLDILRAGGQVWYEPPNIAYRVERPDDE